MRSSRSRIRSIRRVLVVVTCLGLVAAVRPPLQDVLRGIRAEQIRAHTAFLSDDLIEGRRAGSRGARLAARYIAAQLTRAGVEPVRGSFFQRVPLSGWTAHPRRTWVQVSTAAGVRRLQQDDAVMLWLGAAPDSVTVRGDVVFAGYGVVAPEYDWDDYGARDVRGRIVLVLAGDPPAPPGTPRMFDGPALTRYGRFDYKVAEAARRGAAAVLIVHTDDGAGYSWDVVRSSWNGEQLALAGDSADTMARGWITYAAARSLLAAGEADLDQLYVRAARRDFMATGTGAAVTLQATGTRRALESYNVVGLVRGAHAQRASEYVVYTAHYDGLGIGPAEAGDSIYNGAYDNASGVAAVLEVAEAFAGLEPRTDRSMLFLFTTAEEAGLLGAEYYVRNPLVPLDRTVAAINIDGANVWGETEDIGGVGIERSTLGTHLERAASSLDLQAQPEQAPELGLFFRSDQYVFARAGIPAVALEHGLLFTGRDASWGVATTAEYQRTRYHRPGDEFSPGMVFGGAVQQARVAFLMGVDIGNTPRAPRWYEDGGFTARSGDR